MLDEYIEDGSLKRIKPRKEEIEKEMKESDSDLADAKKSFESGRYKWSIVQTYYSMFHAARAVVMSLGFKERKHFVIPIVIDTLLVKKGKLKSYYVDDFKAAMFAREEADYEAEYSEERALHLIGVAEEFGKTMAKLVETARIDKKE